MEAHWIILWMFLLATIGALDGCYEGLLDFNSPSFSKEIGITHGLPGGIGSMKYGAIQRGDFVFPNLKFTCNGTITKLKLRVAFIPNPTQITHWSRYLRVNLSLWQQKIDLLSLNPVSQYPIKVDVLLQNSSQNLGFKQNTNHTGSFFIPPSNSSGKVVNIEMNATNITVREGDMVGLSVPTSTESALHVVYAKATDSQTQLATNSHTYCNTTEKLWTFIAWQPLIAIEFVETEKDLQQSRPHHNHHSESKKALEAGIIVLCLLLAGAIIAIVVLTALVLNLRSKLKVIVTFTQLRNPNSLGRALPIPVSSRRNTDQSSTIYSELDDNTIKVLNRTYDSVVNASNPYTTGGTLDVIEEFANDDVFYPPADTEEDLYEQLACRDIQEITKSLITLEEKMGEGEFGYVYRGRCKGIDTDLAIKVSKEDTEDNVPLLKEAVTMGQFRHPQIVQLLGLVTAGDPIMMVMEHLPNGNLSSHLQSHDSPDSYINEDGLPQKLLRFCSEICDGLNYLSKKGFVHRDLAARNILLDKDYHCKIADFGMSRYLEEESYYITKGGRIPLKWTAPEAILYRKYSTKSDVWSYGMVIYEIWSLGHKPFEEFATEEVMRILNTGYCQPPPTNCPRDIYGLMVECWNPKHQERPEFSSLLVCLEQMDIERWINWMQETYDRDKNVTIRYEDLQFKYSFGTSNN